VSPATADDEALLANYLADIARYPTLTADEERELIRSIRDAGEPEAGLGERRLIQSNLKLVVSIAERYRWAALPFLDVIQEGNLGLMRAVRQFDPAKASPFGAVAAWCIRTQIERSVGRFPAGGG
jgi:DNA-directed RNA polymerase sigma subunit (sigma70/sigma32)